MMNTDNDPEPRPGSDRQWWLTEGAEYCFVCEASAHAEVLTYCIACDRAVCTLCLDDSAHRDQPICRECAAELDARTR